MTPIERAAREICATSMHSGFCALVGGDLGCKSGRGQPMIGANCIATHDQLMMSGYIETARAVQRALSDIAAPE